MNGWKDRDADLQAGMKIIYKHQTRAADGKLPLFKHLELKGDGIEVAMPEWTQELVAYFNGKYGESGFGYFRMFIREIWYDING